ncbi:MAG TPA: DUF2064 domain-containing protein [Luteitalea sp.]|nr:DUF2064 domain-containing protein [Luteitalea sp.]
MKVVAVLVAARPRPASGMDSVAAAAIAAIEAARAVPGAVVRVATPADDVAAVAAQCNVQPAHVVALQGDDPGAWRQAIFKDLFRRGARQVVLVDAEAPPFAAQVLSDAFAALSADAGLVALGPVDDGGCYLLGLAGPKVPDLFTGVRWGTRYVLMDILRRCEFESRRVEFLPLSPAADQACSAS